MSKADEIRIIDLLNKIANGEKLPKKILYFDKVFYLIKTEDDFYTYSMREDIKDWESWINNKTNLIRNINATALILDNEFELIEENTIDIDSIKELKEFSDVSDYDELSIEENRAKINKLIQWAKQIDKS